MDQTTNNLLAQVISKKKRLASQSKMDRQTDGEAFDEMSTSSEKRANFSSVIGGNNANGALVNKMPSTGAAPKPGDIKKLVIKNFKRKSKYLNINSAHSLGKL